METFKDTDENESYDEKTEEPSSSSKTDLAGDESADKACEDPKENGANEDNVTMSNLKVMEFYSADDIRQTMKYVLNENTVHMSEGGNDKIVRTEAECMDKSNSLPQETSQSNANKKQISGSKPRGRPPKPKSSKTAKKKSVTDFYNGKLANLVRFRKHRNY